MYVCKECGNYYQFVGSGSVTLTNKVYKSGDFRAEVEEELESTEFLCCKECASNAIADVDIKTLPERLKDEIYNTATMGCIDEDVMKSLKEIANK